MDYMFFKRQLSCAIRSGSREKLRLPEALWLRFATGHKRKPWLPYAFNAGETPEEVLFNIEISRTVESTSRRHSGEICAAGNIIILGHPAIELAKNLVWEQNRQYLS